MIGAADLYERISAACCSTHGFDDDTVLETHIRAITLHLLDLRGLLPKVRDEGLEVA